MSKKIKNQIEEIIDRLNNFVEYTHLSKTGFALQCRIDKGNFAKMLTGEQSITVRTIDRICAAFPEVSRDWLLNGVGTMLNPSPFIHQAGDNNTAVGHNSTVNSSDALVLAINELSAQRRVTEKAQEQTQLAINELSAQRRMTEKAQEQIDRLITMLECYINNLKSKINL